MRTCVSWRDQSPLLSIPKESETLLVTPPESPFTNREFQLAPVWKEVAVASPPELGAAVKDRILNYCREWVSLRSLLSGETI
jgi:hypothetical protein